MLIKCCNEPDCNRELEVLPQHAGPDVLMARGHGTEVTIPLTDVVREQLITALLSNMRDDCQLCHGERGGEPGNENIARIAGRNVVVCDYCTARLMDKPVVTFELGQ